MEIGLGRVDGVPAQIVGHRGGRGAFVEVAAHGHVFAFHFHAYQRQGYHHQQVPREEAFEFAEGRLPQEG